MIRPHEVLVAAAEEDLAAVGRLIRKQGWDARLHVETVGAGNEAAFRVSLQIEIPHFPVPREAIPPPFPGPREAQHRE